MIVSVVLLDCSCEYHFSALNIFVPHEGKPGLWELDSDYYLHVCGIGDDVVPKGYSPTDVDPVGSVLCMISSIPIFCHSLLNVESWDTWGEEEGQEVDVVGYGDRDLVKGCLGVHFGTACCCSLLVLAVDYIHEASIGNLNFLLCYSILSVDLKISPTKWYQRVVRVQWGLYRMIWRLKLRIM
ncbi:hypothetical protein L1887_02504 [Cichorium endivia]|nr:hypothetical protein L1887_02504 [Cichorium endivia]